ncbi:hypothetical protein, partial [Staphylococcus aureus]|uniref:hypothetical protein n=1 Tax=Staphylococcus aureus TaxID=1280 RepID=UPI0039BDBA46
MIDELARIPVCFRFDVRSVLSVQLASRERGGACCVSDGIVVLVATPLLRGLLLRASAPATRGLTMFLLFEHRQPLPACARRNLRLHQASVEALYFVAGCVVCVICGGLALCVSLLTVFVLSECATLPHALV